MLGDAALAADPRFDANVRRVANRPALDAIILAAFAKAPREEIVARLEAAKVAYGRVSSLDDLKAHPQNRHIEVDTPAGWKRLLAPGAVHDGETPRFGPVPALGQHTAAARREFG